MLEKLVEKELFICWGNLSKYFLQIDSQPVGKFVAEITGLTRVMQLQSKHCHLKLDVLWRVQANLNAVVVFVMLIAETKQQMCAYKGAD